MIEEGNVVKTNTGDKVTVFKKYWQPFLRRHVAFVMYSNGEYCTMLVDELVPNNNKIDWQKDGF